MKQVYIAILLVVLGLNTKAQLCFNPATNFSVATHPQSITSADFNGDGFLDLASVENSGISVLLGLGNGNFGTASTVTISVMAASIVSADFNNDGKIDFISYMGQRLK